MKGEIVVMEGGRVSMKGRMTVSEEASPVRERNGNHVTEKGQVVIKVAKEAEHSNSVVKAKDGWEVKAV